MDRRSVLIPVGPEDLGPLSDLASVYDARVIAEIVLSPKGSASKVRFYVKISPIKEKSNNHEWIKRFLKLIGIDGNLGLKVSIPRKSDIGSALFVINKIKDFYLVPKLDMGRVGEKTLDWLKETLNAFSDDKKLIVPFEKKVSEADFVKLLKATFSSAIVPPSPTRDYWIVTLVNEYKPYELCCNNKRIAFSISLAPRERAADRLVGLAYKALVDSYKNTNPSESEKDFSNFSIQKDSLEASILVYVPIVRFYTYENQPVIAKIERSKEKGKEDHVVVSIEARIKKIEPLVYYLQSSYSSSATGSVASRGKRFFFSETAEAGLSFILYRKDILNPKNVRAVTLRFEEYSGTKESPVVYIPKSFEISYNVKGKGTKSEELTEKSVVLASDLRRLVSPDHIGKVSKAVEAINNLAHLIFFSGAFTKGLQESLELPKPEFVYSGAKYLHDTEEVDSCLSLGGVNKRIQLLDIERDIERPHAYSLVRSMSSVVAEEIEKTMVEYGKKAGLSLSIGDLCKFSSFSLLLLPKVSVKASPFVERDFRILSKESRYFLPLMDSFCSILFLLIASSLPNNKEPHLFMDLVKRIEDIEKVFPNEVGLPDNRLFTLDSTKVSFVQVISSGKRVLEDTFGVVYSVEKRANFDVIVDFDLLEPSIDIDSSILQVRINSNIGLDAKRAVWVATPKT